ncbi:MAG: Mur ligase family protein, partial [Candidatus Binatia bacterium]
MRQAIHMSEGGASATIGSLLGRLREAGFECETNSPLQARISGVAQDSRAVRPGDVFLALPGTRTDGSEYIADALAAGAVAAVCSRDVAANGIPRILVDDVVRAAGIVAAFALGDPAERMHLIGVTGTNGKTSCTYLLDHVLGAAGMRVGVLGTISQRWPGEERTASMTTPPTVELHRTLVDMAAAGCGWVAMEVSSHALSQHRVAGCRFDTAIFTNLTRDHLDYHGDEETYFAAKASLFLEYLDPRVGVAVLNAEDPYAMRLAEMLGPDRCRTYTTLEDEACDVSVVRADLGL